MTADEFVNRMSGYSYVSTRSRHYRDTLQAARLGHLAPNWRDNLRPISAQVGGPEYHVDAEATAVAELQNLPIMPWEPHQADWRMALDCWYSAARKAAVEDYANKALESLEQLRRSPMVEALIPGRKLAESILTLVAPHDNRVNETRHLQDWLYVTETTSLTAAYMAGLAAGGEEIDWRSWYREQITAWPDGHMMRRRAEAEIQHGRYEFLPEYWVNAQPLS